MRSAPARRERTRTIEPVTQICEFAFPGPLRDRLVAAVLSDARGADQSIPGLVQRVLGAESRCP